MTSFDYMELIVVNKDDPTSYDIQQEQFHRMIQLMIVNKHYKMFQVDTQEYIYGTVHMFKNICNGEVQEVKVYNMVPIHFASDNGLLTVKYERQKLSSVTFPSVTEIDMVKLYRRLIFRVNNKIYVNFQIEKTDTEAFVRKVYVNFNNSHDTDVSDSTKILEQVVAVLQSL